MADISPFGFFVLWMYVRVQESGRNLKAPFSTVGLHIVLHLFLSQDDRDSAKHEIDACNFQSRGPRWLRFGDFG